MEESRVPVLKGDCNMCRLAEQFNWNKTSLGDLASWSPAMRILVNTTLHSSAPISTLWGNDLVQIYNDAFCNMIGHKHPGAFGAPAKEFWSDHWQQIGPLLQTVLTEGKSFQLDENQVNIRLNESTENSQCTFSFSPVFNDNKNIEGILVTGSAGNSKQEKPSE